ncbi:hypothetical protein [Mycobacterium sp.]|uniref:hypothetical protein n=1 Tax=Mycobacterium sp. TaxID=1785 RepID=UPI003BB0EED4
MTQFTITLSDGRTVAVQADEITTRTDGSVWLLAAIAPKPQPLTPVLILAARQWTSVSVEDASILYTGEPTQPAIMINPPPTPRFA